MKNAENVGSCPQRDSTECEEYAGAQSAVRQGNEETAGRSQKLLEAILYKDNLNRAYKRVKANKGAPGVDVLPYQRAAGAKYEMVGRTYSVDFDEARPPRMFTECLERAGVPVQVFK